MSWADELQQLARALFEAIRAVVLALVEAMRELRVDREARQMQQAPSCCYWNAPTNGAGFRCPQCGRRWRAL